MNILAVSNALQHVHNNLDVENQWRRARVGLANMTDLERAQVWKALSSQTLTLEQHKAAVVFSQYKTLYKAALKNGATETMTCCAARGTDDAMAVLKEYRDQLLIYYQFMQSFQIKETDESNTELIVEVNKVINNAALMVDVKTEIKTILEAAVGNLAKTVDLKPVIEKEDQILTKLELLVQGHETQTEIKNEIQTQIAAVNTLIAGDMQGLNQQVNDLKLTIMKDLKDIIEVGMSRITEDTNTGFEKLSRKQDTIQPQLDATILTIEKQTQTLIDMINGVSQQTGNFIQAQNGMVEVLESQHKQIDTNMSKTSKLKADLDELTNRLVNVTTLNTEAANAILGTIQEYNNQTERRINEQIKVLKDSLDILTSNVTNLHSGIHAISGIEDIEDEGLPSYVDNSSLLPVSTTVKLMNKGLETKQSVDDMVEHGFKNNDRVVFFNYNPINGARRIKKGDSPLIHDLIFKNYISEQAMKNEFKNIGMNAFMNDNQEIDQITKSIAQNGYIRHGRRYYCNFNPATGSRKYISAKDKTEVRDTDYPNYITRLEMIKEMKGQP